MLKEDKIEREYQSMYRGINRDRFRYFMPILIIIILGEFYLNPILPEFEYFYYRCNAEKYVVVEAEVIDSHEVMAVQGERAPLFNISHRKNEVQYVIDSITYTQTTYAYPDIKESTRIKIAVKIDNHTDLKRCMEFQWETKVKVWICIIVIFISILLWLYYYPSIKDRQYIKKHPVSEYEKRFDEYVAEKQLYILEHMPQCGVAEENLQELKERFTEKGIKFNKGTLWMLSHYGRSQEMSDILNILPLICGGKYFDYIDKLYEQGLPENYYVLSEQDEKYYCCCGESEWLYIYSKGTGITHTQHEAIYDYITEQMDNKTEG